MVNQGIIAKSTIEIKNEKIISYIFNPVYINSCRFINASIYFLFKPYLDKYFPEWIQKQYDILINSKTEINNFESLSNKSITRDKLWKENVGAIFRPQEKHRKIYHDLIISDVIDSKKDVLNIYILYEYIQGNNNAIYFGNHPATVEEISLLLGINERSTKRFLNKISSTKLIFYTLIWLLYILRHEHHNSPNIRNLVHIRLRHHYIHHLPNNHIVAAFHYHYGLIDDLDMYI